MLGKKNGVNQLTFECAFEEELVVFVFPIHGWVGVSLLILGPMMIHKEAHQYCLNSATELRRRDF